MRLLLVILPLLGLVSTSTYGVKLFNCTYGVHEGHLNYKQCYFPQKTDHFLTGNNKQDYWNQMFYLRDLRTEFDYSKEKIVFLYVGGEVEPQSPEVLKFDFCSHYAKKIGALCIYLQHRFYGPSKLDEIQKDNVSLLSTRQALADVNNFIVESKKSLIPKDAKVIVFGCSYSGTLAAWLRLKYPDQVQGAISTSAPLLAKSVLPDFGEHVKKTLNSIDPKCFPKIKLTLQAVMFLCSWINYGFCKDSSIIPYKITYKLYYGQLFDTSGVKDFCQNVIGNVYNSITSLKFEDEWMETWIYQGCNELGWLPIMPDLGLDVEYWTNRCQNIMGQEWNLNKLDLLVDMTNKNYGGLESPKMSNVVFIHGEDDIWKSLGLSKAFNESVHILTVKGGRHCPTLDEWHKDTIEKRLSQWIGQNDE